MDDNGVSGFVPSNYIEIFGEEDKTNNNSSSTNITTASESNESTNESDSLLPKSDNNNSEVISHSLPIDSNLKNNIYLLI